MLVFCDNLETGDFNLHIVAIFGLVPAGQLLRRAIKNDEIPVDGRGHSDRHALYFVCAFVLSSFLLSFFLAEGHESAAEQSVKP